MLSSSGLVAAINGVIQAGQNGWTSTSVLVPVLAGVDLLIGFIAWERRAAHPAVDLALFSYRDFTVGTALSTIANFELFGLLFVMPQYFQDVGCSDPLGTGVRLLPMIGGMVIQLFSARSGRHASDYQLRVTTAAFVAAQLETARCWADGNGTASMGQMMDDAVTIVEPLIASL